MAAVPVAVRGAVAAGVDPLADLRRVLPAEAVAAARLPAGALVASAFLAGFRAGFFAGAAEALGVAAFVIFLVGTVEVSVGGAFVFFAAGFLLPGWDVARDFALGVGFAAPLALAVVLVLVVVVLRWVVVVEPLRALLPVAALGVFRLGALTAARWGVPLLARVDFPVPFAGADVPDPDLADALVRVLAADGLAFAPRLVTVSLLAAFRTARPALRSVDFFFGEEALAALSDFRIIALS